MLVLLAVAGVARYFSVSASQRNALSVVLVVLGLVTAFFFFFGAGSWLREHRVQPTSHAGASSHELFVLPFTAFAPADVLRPSHAAELKRWAS
ncbi:hypothetical protein [Methylibium sp.]|uniref:hypothetical protein n=1 Tax=Methylibium sp. TaxID=2067992 RepID=UPI003D099B99